MNDQEKKEKELLNKLREAGQPNNNFSLTLKFNNIVLEDRIFDANKFSLKTVSETRTHFLMNDLIRKIIESFSEIETKMQDEIKKEQMNKLWEENEKNKNK